MININNNVISIVKQIKKKYILINLNMNKYKFINSKTFFIKRVVYEQWRTSEVGDNQYQDLYI